MIGIIGAMPKEVSGLIEVVSDLRRIQMGRLEFWHGKIFDSEVVIAKSGVGKVSAGITAQAMILQFAPSIVLNTGVAGAIASEVEVGDVVVGSAVVQHDMDTSPLGDPLGFISDLDLVFLKCARVDKLLASAQSESNGAKVHCGMIATGDRFVNEKRDGQKINKEFGALAVEMEGAAVGQSCVTNFVDFCVLRVISDSIYDNSLRNYNEFAKGAAAKSIEIVKSFLK